MARSPASPVAAARPRRRDRRRAGPSTTARTGRPGRPAHQRRVHGQTGGNRRQFLDTRAPTRQRLGGRRECRPGLLAAPGWNGGGGIDHRRGGSQRRGGGAGAVTGGRRRSVEVERHGLALGDEGAPPRDGRTPAEPAGGLEQILGQHADVADHRHEVGVAVPARHQVHVQVIGDAGAGRTAEVEPDVHALRLVGLGERGLGQPRRPGDVDQLVVVQRAERRDVAARHHHQVAAVVGEQVEDDVAGDAVVHQQRTAVVAARRRAEDAALGFTAAGHVGMPPGRPEPFHGGLVRAAATTPRSRRKSPRARRHRG